MKNIEELRTNLCKLFNDLQAGAIDSAKAKEMNNSAGKVISTAKAQIEYYALRKEAPNIPFLASSAQHEGETKPE